MLSFLLTIDTEEEGLWGTEYKRHLDCTVENIFYLPKFQDFCDRLSLRPTYLIDYPVADQQSSVKILKSLLKQNKCEIGTHLHPWCNPPYEEELNERNSYIHNLPVELQFKKMKNLTDLIREKFDIHPASYRAGRYGFDKNFIPILEELNYKIDTSVVPYRKNNRAEEPVFGVVDLEPYFLDNEDILKTGNSNVLEIPITVEFTRKIPKIFKKIYYDIPEIGVRRLLRKGFGLDLVWLRPSYSTEEQMKHLIDTVLASGVSVLNMMFHSTELMPGASPYNKTPEDVDHFLKKIERIVEYTRKRATVRFLTLAEYYSQQEKEPSAKSTSER